MTLNSSPLSRLIESLRPCVADIGARGGVDEDLLPIASSCTVVGFEPEPEEARRLAASGDKRWREVKVLPYAVGGISGPGVLYVPEAPQAASLLPHDAAMVERFGHDYLHVDRKKIPVTTYTLDDLAREGKLPAIDYLKVDIEGAELDVFKAAGSVLDNCVAVKVECSFLPQRVSQPLVWDVVPFLRQQQFEAVDIWDIHRWRRRPIPAHPFRTGFEMAYSRGQLAQCDLVMLRMPAALANDRQALMLVVVACVLGYFDYAMTVVRERPGLSESVRRDHGFDLEAELKGWARATGRREIARAIASQLRQLVPMLRSLTGWLPFKKPAVRY